MQSMKFKHEIVVLQARFRFISSDISEINSISLFSPCISSPDMPVDTFNFFLVDIPIGEDLQVYIW
jgi:hypothetical protein